MKSLIAVVLMVACFSAQADESRSFTSIIRVQAESQTDGAQTESSGISAIDASKSAAQQCENPSTSIVDRIMALLSGLDCEGAITASDGGIDTALQLGPR
jgi:hypothetical protein